MQKEKFPKKAKQGIKIKNNNEKEEEKNSIIILRNKDFNAIDIKETTLENKKVKDIYKTRRSTSTKIEENLQRLQTSLNKISEFVLTQTIYDKVEIQGKEKHSKKEEQSEEEKEEEEEESSKESGPEPEADLEIKTKEEDLIQEPEEKTKSEPEIIMEQKKEPEPETVIKKEKLLYIPPTIKKVENCLLIKKLKKPFIPPKPKPLDNKSIEIFFNDILRFDNGDAGKNLSKEETKDIKKEYLTERTRSDKKPIILKFQNLNNSRAHKVKERKARIIKFTDEDLLPDIKIVSHYNQKLLKKAKKVSNPEIKIKNKSFSHSINNNNKINKHKKIQNEVIQPYNNSRIGK